MKTISNVFSRRSNSVVVLILAILTGFSSCKKDDNSDSMNGQINYSGSFVKSKDLVGTSASGTATATFNSGTMELSYSIVWAGLGTNVVSMHFHDSGPVMAEITGFPNATSGTVSGTVALTAQQATDLASGKIYVQIHTVDYPGGEVLATLSKKSGSPVSTYTSTVGDGYNYGY